jgi:hypothetical protein
MKRTHLNLLLAMLTLGLLAAVYFSQEKPEPPPPPLTSLDSKDINRILIQHSGKPDIRLEKPKDEWWLVAPVIARAETVEVNALLDLASRPSERRYPASEMALGELQLDKPSQVIQLNDLRIEFGGLDAIESQRYVRVGDTVHMIGDPPSAALDADYNDLIAKRLLPADARIRRIQLPGLTLTRSDKDGWQVTPKSADRGADAAQQLADAWQRAQAMWITPLNKKLSAKGGITIEFGEEAFRFEILDRDSQLILSRPDLGVQFTLSKTLVADLFELKPPSEPGPESSEQATDTNGIP